MHSRAERTMLFMLSELLDKIGKPRAAFEHVQRAQASDTPQTDHQTVPMHPHAPRPSHRPPNLPLLPPALMPPHHRRRSPSSGTTYGVNLPM